MEVSQFPDRTIFIDGKEYLYFGGTNYLGLGSNPKFLKILFKSFQRWGTAFGSSRNANVRLQVYAVAEDYLSNFVQTENSVLVSSGMLAGKMVIDLLSKTTDTFYSFPNLHAALHKTGCIPFFLDGTVHPNLLDSKIENITILLDGVASGHTKPFDLTVLNSISESKKITLVIDESHSFGILGENGQGLFSNIKNKTIARTIMTSSLGKAFGLTGGFIASDTEFCELIRSQSNYISSASMNPAFCQTLVDSQNVYSNQLEKLRANLKFLSINLKHNDGFDFTSNYPILNIFSAELNERLYENDIIITNFNYGNGRNKLNRIIITANHTKADLKKLIFVLNQKLI